MTMQRRQLCLAVIGAGLLPVLSACSTAARQLEAAPGKTYWSGRMSVQVLESPPQSTSGSFELSGSAASGELVLLNPLGNIVARVQWSPGQASAQQGTQTRQASSLDELTQTLLGTSLPIAALFDWLQGKPTEAAGWQADLAGRSEGKILARRLDPLPEASLRIVLDAP
ncbi:outer membrane lipoprotein LolB [Comamonas sp. JUb58]|uniref:outer membrane lipoprotein LolB n=1 Tax=Comamonas sp. JUb58 TaxID=2485114 RepID=UPI0010D806E6|nr:outer membrane lipoprotein LolB [Comamonas sp. JUb58]TDS70963.1 outer membrane lipoprotein LolB [Comamonas sp. JUb58]